MKTALFALAAAGFALNPSPAHAELRKSYIVYPRCHYEPHIPKELTGAVARVDLWSNTPSGRYHIAQSEVPTALQWNYDTLKGTFWGAMTYEVGSLPVNEIAIQCVLQLKKGGTEDRPLETIQPVIGMKLEDALREAWESPTSHAYFIELDY